MLARVGGIFGLIFLLFWVYTIFDSITTPAERIRALPKGLWVLIVLIFPPLGSILWLVFGRPYKVASGPATGARAAFGGPSGGSFGPPPRAGSLRSGAARGRAGRRRGQYVAPDDDPDFLRKIADDLRRRSGDPRDPRDSNDPDSK